VLIDHLLGWTRKGRGMKSIYGGKPPIALLADAIIKVDFDLDLAGARRKLSWH
jgi:hypothetical protein